MVVLHQIWLYEIIGVCCWCVKIPQCGYTENGFKHITFYVAALATCYNTGVLRDKPLAGPIYIDICLIRLYVFFQVAVLQSNQNFLYYEVTHRNVIFRTSNMKPIQLFQMTCLQPGQYFLYYKVPHRNAISKKFIANMKILIADFVPTFISNINIIPIN